MRTIQVLDKETIDKIAAGEVVERPASVVKELTENAIDAEATAVTIEIRDGGSAFMRITDNGAGIPASQVRTAFLPHATSKIRKVEDLGQIASLGFRGEALASIAAVAQVECITKTPEALTGVRYTIEGGVEKDFEEIGAPSGTTMIVRNLFFNTPARSKFLRAPATEGNHVSSFVEELALSHPEISFKYIQNGQTRLYTSGNGNLKEIVYQIYGRDLTRELVPIDAQTERLHIVGFIGNPNISRGNRNFENYFINGRYVKSRVIMKAIEDAYHGFLMQHRYPFTLLYLDIDGTKVDVNVHPQKMEVRLSDQEEIYHELCLSIQNALMNRERIPQVPLGRERTGTSGGPDKLPVLDGGRPEPFESVRRREEAGASRTNPTAARNENDSDRRNATAGVTAPDRTSTNPVAGQQTPSAENQPQVLSSQVAEKSRYQAGGQTNRSALQPGQTVHQNSTQPSQAAPQRVPQGGHESVSGTKPSQMNLFEEDKVLSQQARKMFRLIGQVFETYWLIEYRDSLYIIDQHAAHEKVNYERMMKAYREKKINSQMLYPAVVVSLSAKESQLLSTHTDAFEKLGFEIEPFGKNTWKVNAVPDNLYSVASDQLFIQILDQLGDLGEIDPSLIPERIASMSCKAAVKGNNKLSFREAEALIDELLTLENPYNCPHGRPTIISISKYEMDKKFKRIV